MVSTTSLFTAVVAACAMLSTTTVSAQATKGFQTCPAAPAKPEDRRVDKTKLTYATYNVEFLFLVGYGQLDCPGSGCKWTTVDDAQRHIKQTAKNIKAMNADIIQLNEVEDCAVLRALVAELAALGDSSYKPYLVRGSDSATGQNSALITRVDPSVDLQRSEASVTLPVAQSKCPAASGYSKSKGVAKHFYTTFNVAGFSSPITVIGAHLLANPSNKARCFEREGQATVLSSLMQQFKTKGHHVILSGDLNDFSLTAPDRNDNKPISNALGIMESQGFVNAAVFADKPSRFSQWWDRNKDCVFMPTEVSTLDHIIISDSLRAGVANVAYRHDLYTSSCDSFSSDHFPIAMTLSPL